MINVITVRWFVPLSNGKIGRKADMLYFIAPVILAILKCPCHKGMAALVSMDVYHIRREHWSDNVTWSKLIPPQDGPVNFTFLCHAKSRAKGRENIQEDIQREGERARWFHQLVSCPVQTCGHYGQPPEWTLTDSPGQPRRCSPRSHVADLERCVDPGLTHSDQDADDST